ncbi:hypothetical protein OG592_06250 [Streptomyces avidinii]|uniref:hypothetical protein n=1 Tax=Streptomyces avidinii TaxID=1895 RepID=UPI00386ACF22|nr:hypothetical protein OG592_06250 [Streptomyces avidinii]
MTPSPEQVYDALVRRRHDGTIDLPAAVAAEPDLSALGPALDLLRAGSSWSVLVGELTWNARSVDLTGDASFAVPGGEVFAVGVTLAYATGDDGGVFALRLATAPGWTFGAAFPTLPPTPIQEGGTVSYRPSFLADLPVSGVAFAATATTGGTAALRLTGAVGESPLFEAFADFFGPFPLRFDGPVSIPADAASPPDLSLFAASTRQPVTLGPVALEHFGLRLATELGLDPAVSPVSSYSAVYGEATLRLGTTEPVTGTVSTPLLAMATTWLMNVTFPEDDAPGLGGGLAGIASMLGLPADLLAAPRSFDDFTGFRISEIDLSLLAPSATGGLPALDYVAVVFRSAKRWTPPVPYLVVSNVGMRWLALWGGGAPSVSGTVFGTLEVGRADLERRMLSAGSPPHVAIGEDASVPAPATPQDPVFSLDVMTYFPQFVVTGALSQGDIPLDQALGWLFGVTFPYVLDITQFEFEADLQAQTFTGSALVTTDFSLRVGDVEIQLSDVFLRVDVLQSGVAGGITATFVLPGVGPAGSGDASFAVGASYAPSADWEFTGELGAGDQVDLVTLVRKFMDKASNNELPSVSLTQLSLRFAPTPGTYDLAGAVIGVWRPVILGQPRDLSIGARVAVSRDAQSGVSGSVTGTFSVNKLAVSAGVDFAAKQLAYLLKIQFGDLWVSAVTSRRGEDSHQVVSVRLGGVTLGEIIEYLIGLAAPTVKVTLDPPWDILYRIDLSSFVLTVDPTESTVEFTYATTANLGVMSADTVGVRWKRQPDGRATVEMILTGNFLGQDYPAQRPLSWDLLGGSPPAVPGQGKTLFDLGYLGIGQRVSLRGSYPDTIRDTVAQLRKDMKPVKPDGNPVGKMPALAFSPDSEWLIGFQAAFLDTLDLSFVFNDPRLYGLAVGLRGERAGSLAGLQFEILYKKISDDIGMFRVELRLPDAFRRIDFGAVSVTVGIVVVEVYTNGDFLVDLGFPHGRDFSRSFSVEVLPFVGRGGVYFGVLSGATSSRVPRVSNGTFAPVLELGVGLAVGVGKEVSYGPLSGGAYVEVLALFQGVLAWFNPTSSGSAPATYYWAQAVVGIHGKVYGRIDFKIVQVNVTIEAWAEASVELAAYRTTVFRLNVGVSVKASVKVLFITVSFSFSARIDVGFTVGHDRPTPWIVSGGQSAPTAALLRSSCLPPLRSPGRRAAALAAPRGTTVTWDPTAKVFPDAPRTAELTLLPAFSVGGIAIGWGVTPTAPEAPTYRAALLLFAPLHAPAGTTPGAELLVEAFLRWCLAAVTGSSGNGSPTVTAGRLDVLARALRDPGQTDAPFGVEDLATFLATNLHIDVTGRPAGDNPADVEGMVVGVPPFVAWTSPQAQGRDLATYRKVGPLYEWGITEYAARFAATPAPLPPKPDDPLGAYESFASYVFRDWCLALARAAVQEAADLLADWTVPAPTAPVSLAEIASQFPRVTVAYAVRAGDTLDSVAEALGTTAAELAFLDPGLAQDLADAAAGTVLQVELGVCAESVALANADFSLTVTGPLPLGTVDHQVEAAQTLAAVALRFGVANPDLIAQVIDDAALLRAGAVLEVPAFTLTQGAFTSTVTAAAAMFVHYVPDAEVEGLDWYLQALHHLDPGYTAGGGTELRVPVDFGDWSRSATYTTLPGDSVRSVAASLALAQSAGTGTGGPPGWPAFRDAVTRTPDGSGFAVPAAKTRIQPRETLAALAARTVAYTSATVGQLVATADILTPLALVPVPDVAATVTAGRDTLAALAAYYALPVTDLAERIATRPVFARTGDRTELHVPHVPAASIDQIVARVTTGEPVRRVAGLVSRQLLSGQRVPAPVDAGGGHLAATGALTPLHDLTGQQFDSPAPDPSDPDAVALHVDLTSAADWLVLRESATADGAVVRGEVTSELTLEFTNADLLRLYPPTVMTVEPVSPPAPLPLGEPAPVTYGLDHRIELQSPIALPVPGRDAAATGSASLWPFPAALRARAALRPTMPYDVVRTAAPGLTPKPGDIVGDSTFATTVTFGVRKVGALAHVYELVGVDTTDRDVLLALWTHMAAGNGAVAFLAVAPPPDASNTSGLAVLAADTSATFVLKTNESTESKPPAGAAAGSGQQLCAASLADVADFLVLLWQGSVVGGTGYYLHYRSATDDDLPPGAFDPDGLARLSLLVVLDDRAEPAPGGRTLLPFDTCAVLAPGLDPSAHALYVEAAEPGAETVIVPVVPQGLTGFTTTLPQPPPPDDDSPEARVARLFSLLTYDAATPLGACGLPVPPADGDGTGLPAWHRDRLARARRFGRAVAEADPVHWRFQQVIPYARTATPAPTPAVPGLPDTAADPYRGIAGKTTPVAGITLGLCDVLGNTGVSTGKDGATPYLVEAPAGYTDALLTLTQWPAVSLSYAVTSGSAGPLLTVAIAPQAGATAPEPGDSAAGAIQAAARQAERYATAYYQLAGGRTEASLVTTLMPGADGAPDPLAVDVTPLWRYAAASFLASVAAAATAPATASATVAHLVASYGASLEGLATANATADAAVLFGPDAPAVPAFGVFAEGRSADDLVHGLAAGWPHPANGAALLALEENADLPLRPGAVLTIPSAPVAVAHPDAPLDAVAASAHTLPGLLATDNATTPGVLRPGFVLLWEDVPYEVPQQQPYSFADAAAAYTALGHEVDVATLAAANATRAGILAPDAALTSRHYIAVGGDTLAANASGATGSVLADANGATADLFEAGTLLYAGDFAGVTVPPGQTLHELADRYACPPALLLAANAGRRITDAVLPGRVTLPETVRVPYTLRPDDTLDALGPAFGTTGLGLGDLNAAMPGVLAPYRTVSVDTPAGPAATETTVDDTLDAVWQRLAAQGEVTFEQTVAAVGSEASYLAEGALLVCGPAVLAGTGPEVTPADAAAAYGLDPTAFVQANAGVTGLVAEGVALTAGGVTVTTGAHDSLNTVLTRFAAAGAALTSVGLVTALADVAFLRRGARALLPQARVSVTAVLPAELPLESTTLPFALTVALRLARPDVLVDPVFRTADGSGAAERADAPVPPHVTDSGEPGEQSLTMAEFETSFREAFPLLRLATGRAPDGATDLSVVAFTAGGITDVQVAPGLTWQDRDGSARTMPRVFALRPLSKELVSRNAVPVHPLGPDGRLASDATPTDFDSVDAEVWARRLLADVDLFLTAAYATAVHADPESGDALARVLAAKRTLSRAVARGLWPVLDVDDPHAVPAQAAAVARLADELSVNLSRAYDAAALVQYDATVEPPSNTVGGRPARLYGTLATPPGASYTLSSAKTDLSAASSYVGFLLRLPDPRWQAHVPVDLDYGFLDLEYDVAAEPQIGGYEASRWLAFYPPLTGDAKPPALRTSLGRADVPVPLRAYPASPVLLGQTAGATFGQEPPTLAGAPLWTYAVSYAHEHAAQDEVRVTAAFNVTVGAGPADADADDVVSALARYVSVADGLWSLLAGYVSEPGSGSGSGDGAARANAAKTFADLVGLVADAWDRRWPAPGPAATEPPAGPAIVEPPAATPGPDPVEVTIGVRVGYTVEDGATYLAAVELTPVTALPGPGGAWPEVAYVDAAGTVVPLVPDAPVGDSRTYRFDPPLPATGWPQFRLAWPGLHVMAYQNARATLTVRRNTRLVPDGPPTDEQFVFRTAPAVAPDVVTPLNIWDEPVDLTGLGPLDDALTAAFTALAGDSTDAGGAVGVGYGFQIVAGTDGSAGIVSRLPIALAHVVVDRSTGATVGQVATDWLTENDPPATRARLFTFSLTLFSQLDPSAVRPLLTMPQLIHRIL